MKLRSLSVNQFKKFTTPHRLDGIGDELNLFVGPNEHGKSTLLDALQAVLFARYGSKAKPIQELQNDRSAAAPVVELIFEIDGSEYVLKKRFLKREYAKLQCPNGAVLEADAAEAELRRLLEFEAPGNWGANRESPGMWGVLWVQQGKSFGRPELTSQAQQTLTDSVQAEIGELLGGQRGRQLPEVVGAQLAELVTQKRQQPTGRYKDAVVDEESFVSQLNELRQRQGQVAETLQRLSRAQDELGQLEADSQDRKDQEELDESRRELVRVKQHQSKVEAANSELENRTRALGHKLNAQSKRNDRRAELMRERNELGESQERLKALRQEESEAHGPLNQLKKAHEAAEKAVESAVQYEATWREIEQAVGQTEEMTSLQSRQAQLLQAQVRLEGARSAVAEVKLDDSLLQRIRTVSRELAEANARLSGAATQIRFVFADGRQDGVAVNGEPVSDAHATYEAIEPATISIADRGRIIIDPQLADGSEMREAQLESRSAFEAALAEAGVRSLAEAEDLRDSRRDLEARFDAAELEVSRLEPWGENEVQRLDALSAWQQSLSVELKEAVAAHGRLEATERFQEAQQATRDRRDEEGDARAAHDQCRQSVQDLTDRVLALQGAVDTNSERIAREEEVFKADVEERPDESIAEEVLTAESALMDQRRELETLQAEAAPSDGAHLEARIKQLEGELGDRRNSRGSLEREIANLRGQIEVQDGAGIDESIDQRQRELDHAQSVTAAYEREAAVLNLLLKTLRDAEQEARDRYLEPIVNKVQPYLKILFPDDPSVQVSLNDTFNVVGVSRESGYEEEFEHLSMGTQEQIAVVVRLAFAEMLVAQGTPAAVILDDALVFSDDTRMKAMFDILSHAAKSVQIIVITCRKQLFEGLGAKHLQLQPGDPESLRSA